MIVDPQVMAELPSRVLDAAKHKPIAPIPSIVPDIVYEYVGDAGKRTFWVVFIIMLVSTVVFTGITWRVPVAKRLYHVITTFIVATAAISYFAMASGDGIAIKHTPVPHHHAHAPTTHTDVYRQIFWARYVDWSLTTPLLLLDLALVAGLNGSSILIAIFADLVMILTGLFAAFGDESNAQKWGWYTIACAAYLVIVYQLAVNGRASALSKGGKVGGFFASIAGFTLILWTAYPIVWGIADGARKVDVDGEIIAYAILDVLAKPVFGTWLLLTHANLPETNVDLGGFWSHGLSSEGTIRVGDDADGA